MNKFINIKVLVIVSSLLLSGCTLVMIGSTIVTKTILDSRTIGAQIDDSITKLRIYGKLLKNKVINSRTHIEVIVYKNIVLLTGQVPYAELINHIQQIVSSTTGVEKVYNEIRNKPKVTYRTIFHDTLISIEIYIQLLINQRVNISNIKILTQNGEVFLIGAIGYQESLALIKLINRTLNVKKVTIIYFQ